mmetsp:Transcript_444/g.1178  ORF Transcript_444/g.1178 Transcript_444/m.1178 type:complete len:261 (+) Transcript_444:1269-2051(+)
MVLPAGSPSGSCASAASSPLPTHACRSTGSNLQVMRRPVSSPSSLSASSLPASASSKPRALAVCTARASEKLDSTLPPAPAGLRPVSTSIGAAPSLPASCLPSPPCSPPPSVHSAWPFASTGKAPAPAGAARCCLAPLSGPSPASLPSQRSRLRPAAPVGVAVAVGACSGSTTPIAAILLKGSEQSCWLLPAIAVLLPAASAACTGCLPVRARPVPSSSSPSSSSPVSAGAAAFLPALGGNAASALPALPTLPAAPALAF